jgi:hypothetical protein
MKYLITYQLIQLSLLQIFVTVISSNIKKDMRQGMWHIRRRGEVHTEILWGNVRERDHLEHLGINVRVILKWIL